MKGAEQWNELIPLEMSRTRSTLAFVRFVSIYASPPPPSSQTLSPFYARMLFESKRKRNKKSRVAREIGPRRDACARSIYLTQHRFDFWRRRARMCLYIHEKLTNHFSSFNLSHRTSALSFQTSFLPSLSAVPSFFLILSGGNTSPCSTSDVSKLPFLCLALGFA